MHKNLIWVLFLSAVIVVSIWFTTAAIGALFHYYSLKEKVEATIEKWEIKEVKKEGYTLFATFAYSFKEKTYKSYDRMNRTFPNSWAAEKEKLKVNGKKTFIWIDPQHPEKGKLEKRFPFKKCASACILLGITFYFFILGYYVNKRHANG